MSDSLIEKLRQRQKKLEVTRRKINAQIRKAELEERKQRYENAGKDLEKIFKADKCCSDSKKIEAICNKYFGEPSLP